MTLGAILLLLAALACVAAELFLPTHGVLAIGAAVLALLSVVLAAKASAALGVAFGLGIIVVSPIVFYWAIRLYPHTPMGRRVMLKAPAAVSENSVGGRELVGKRGVAMTPLRLTGNVDLDGERIACVSEAGVIEAGTAVEVIRVTGPRVVVRPVNS